MSITKQCTKCGEVKALDAFRAHPQGKHGKTPRCKVCLASVDTIYRQENKEQIAESDRKYHQKNKAKVTDRKRRHYQENKERILERQRKYNQENPERHRRANHKRRALKRNLPHQPLTPQQYEILHRQKYEIFGGIANEH